MSVKGRQRCLNGLIYFRIYEEKGGSTKELCELEEDCEEPEIWLEELSNEIREMFETYVRTNFTIVKMVLQVETYTRNAGPLIDYCIVHTDTGLTESALANFKFEICKKDEESTLYATTTMLPSSGMDFAKMLRAPVAKYLL